MWVRNVWVRKIHGYETTGYPSGSDHLCSKGLLPNKIALAARRMETLLGAEFKTLDSILYLNVDLKIVFIN